MTGWFKIPAAAEYMGLSPRSVRPMLKQGLKHSKLPSGTILMSIKWIDEYLESFQISENETKQPAQMIESEVDRLIREIKTGR